MKKLLMTLLCLATYMSGFAGNTQATVYYAVPSSVVKTYTVKLNVNHKGDGVDYESWVMSKTDKQYQGKDIYSCTFTSKYDGAGVMQFQLYDGESWKGQDYAIGSDNGSGGSNRDWKTIDFFNGRMFIHDTTNDWGKYQTDDNTASVKYHVKFTNSNTPSHAYEYNGSIKNASFPGSDAVSENSLCSGWYDYTATKVPYAYIIFSDGNSGEGHQAATEDIGDDNEYWITYNGTSNTRSTTPPADFTYTRNATSADKYGTICLPYAVTTVSTDVTNATIYKVSSKVMSGETLTGLYLEEVTSMEAGKAYIYKSTAAGDITFTLADNYTNAVAANGMVGNLGASTEVPADKYVIQDNKIRKVTTSGVNVGQYKAYIDISTVSDYSPSPAPGLIFVSAFDNNTTGINTIKGSDSEKLSSEVYNNLAGQRVAQPLKGLYIVNGRKVVIK